MLFQQVIISCGIIIKYVGQGMLDAPIVEGAVLAAVEASLGKNLEEVLAVIEKNSIINKNNL